MKGTRFTRLISVMLSIMLVLTLFPTQALASDDETPPASATPEPTPSPVTIYTVKFVDWDGREIASVLVAEGAGASAPAHPAREGYVSDGWDKDFSKIEGNLTVTALYKEATPTPGGLMFAAAVAPTPIVYNTVTVKFYSKDGNYITSYTISEMTNAQINDLPDKGLNLLNTLNGIHNAKYSSFFLGKSTFSNSDIESNGKIELNGRSPSYSVRVDLNYEMGTTYTVRYVSTGGRSIAADVSGTGEVGETVDETAKTIEGYIRVSPRVQWLKLEYDVSENVITFTYSPITYNITYVLSGGTNGAGNPTTYTPDSPEIILTAPTRANYNFVSWTPSGTLPAGSTGNKQFTAVWEATKYPIQYNLGGGQNASSNPESYTYFTPTITLANPSRNGYTFDKWSPSNSIPLNSTGPKTFTASWKPITYNISYTLNNGTNDSRNPGSYTPDDLTINLLPPTRTGYTFNGWSPAGVIPTGSYNDKSFEALWLADTFTIHYTMNGGTNPDENPTTFTPDDEEIVLATPSRDGYTFAGWSPEGVIPQGTTEDQYFEARWTANTFTVHYTMNGGTNPDGNPTSFTPDDEEILLLDPARDGYTFAGWSPEGVIPQGTIVDQYFEARWTANPYTIHYIMNGGSNPDTNPTSYTPDDEDITLDDPTRTGYSFDGWSPSNTIPSGSIGELTFTAKWKANTYTITYILNDGTNATGNPATFTPDSPTITLLNPTRSGYTFTGWTPGNTIPTGTTESKTFEATWSAVAYSITYRLNGGTNAPENPVSYTKESPRINLATPTRTGYTFVRWSPLSYIPAGSTGNKTFTAYWTATDYPITYNLGGGVNSILNPHSYDIEDNTITLRDPSRIGYNFTGWTPTGTIPAGSTGAKEFTAGWTPKTYSISYELYGGTNAGTNPTSYTIETDTIHLADPTRPGYAFLGWLLSDTISKGSVGDRTFYAVWSLPIRYSITYNLNGGVNDPSNPSRYWVISNAITLANPTRTGYDFVAWSPSDSIPSGSTGNLEFTASWTPISYSITYDLAGGSATGNPSSYTIETPTFTLNDPTREFYTFAGWTPADATIEQGSTGAKSFTAKWTPDSFAIHYLLNGGSATGNPASYTIETPTFTLNDPTRDYYTFAGWTPDDVTVEQGTTGELTFSASWTPIAYSITYDLAGGINAPTNPETYTIETPDFTLANPSRLGYDFTGWVPDDTTIELGSHGDKSFRATWSNPLIYTITYDLAGGVNAPTNPATFTIESAAITLAAPTRAGYNFTGWTPEGTIPAGSTGNRAFTATWSAPIVYPITYVMNGGVNAGANPATYTVESPAIALAAPTRAGYNFTGWTPAGGIPAGSTGARTFTATWSAPIEYDITYVLNGGVNAAGNPASYNVTSGEIALLDATRTGYDFLGWTPTDSIPAASTGERTFTATWSQPHVHTVTYFVSGGTQAGLDGATPFAVYRDIAYGSPVPIPDDPAEAEYTFDGWSSEIPATMPDEDVVLYGTLTKSPVLQEIIANEKTPLAAPTWSLLNLIFAALTALGLGSIVSMLLKKRNGTASPRNTLFSLLTLVPAAGAILAFILTQAASGNMVFADRWSVLMGGITLLQGALVALGFFGGKKA